MTRAERIEKAARAMFTVNDCFTVSPDEIDDLRAALDAPADEGDAIREAKREAWDEGAQTQFLWLMDRLNAKLIQKGDTLPSNPYALASTDPTGEKI